MKINDIIIIGGGCSINEGIPLGLKDKIKDKLIIATNYSYLHFPHTFLTFYDRDFYVPSYAKKYPDQHPDIYEELKKEPLIIGYHKNDGLSEFLLPNTILINCPKKELPNPYSTGIFALCIAERLKPKTIYLCGFDWPRQPIPQDKTLYNPKSNLDIHYYQKEIQHSGLGYTGFYDNHNPDKYFKFFKNSNSKIYNVSLNSNINNFEKITYKQMFNLLDNQIIIPDYIEMLQKLTHNKN